MAAKKTSKPTPFDLNHFLATRTESVNAALDRFLPTEKTKPATIHKAMRYSLFAGGKRMRPAVLLAAVGVFGTGTLWPDLVVAVIMGGLGLSGGWQIVRHARRDLRDFAATRPVAAE